MWWVVASWLAAVLGIAGMWVAGRHASGWLIGSVGCVLWVAFNTEITAWAGVFSSGVTLAVSLRNWSVNRSQVRESVGDRVDNPGMTRPLFQFRGRKLISRQVLCGPLDHKWTRRISGSLCSRCRIFSPYYMLELRQSRRARFAKRVLPWL